MGESFKQTLNKGVKIGQNLFSLKTFYEQIPAWIPQNESKK